MSRSGARSALAAGGKDKLDIEAKGHKGAVQETRGNSIPLLSRPIDRGIGVRWS